MRAISDRLKANARKLKKTHKHLEDLSDDIYSIFASLSVLGTVSTATPQKRPGGPRKLTWGQVQAIRQKLTHGASQAFLAAEYNVSPSLISKIASHKTWTAPPPEDAIDDRGTWRITTGGNKS